MINNIGENCYTKYEDHDTAIDNDNGNSDN